MKKLLANCFRPLAFMLVSLLVPAVTIAQVPGFQDCLGATPICLGTYTNPNVITGTGNIPNEINPATSCLLTGERNDAWYIVTTSTAGNLSFTIIPNNPLHNYDWAVYNLTTSVCADIFSNPSLEVSCNYNNTPGNTGPNGQAGAQNNAVIPVLNGETYLINVSGFSALQQNGYTIDLSGSSAMVTDNTSPAIGSITAMNCGASSLTASFTERVLCNTVQPSDFTLTGPGGPYTITSVTGNSCALNGTYSRDFQLAFSPALLQSGNYTLTLVNTVSDLCGNVTSIPQPFSFTISPINISFQKVDVTCFGGNNGSATAVVSGPAGPYTYQWSPSGGSSASAQWLTAGTYTVTVTSGLGCTSSASVTINQPLSGLSASVATTPANGCAANGTATVTVGSGQAPFTYSWWPTGGNAASANNLSAGSYMVTITDANQCVLNYFFNIPSANGPTVGINVFSGVSCFGGNDGSATVHVTGAPGPFIYQWSPQGGNNATATGLTAGNYTASVIIAPGCTLTATVSITQPPTALSVASNVTHASCGNNTGSIQLAASGGAGPYTYQWNPPVTTGANANNLSGGTYTVTVTDANGCTNQNSYAVQSSSKPVLALTNHNDVTCFGQNNGSTGVTITGGAPPVSILWSSGHSTANISNLTAGTYTVTVTDATGCSVSLTDNILQPAELLLTIQSIDHINCFGELTGSATMQANGGNGGNAWSWTGNSSVTPSINNVVAGIYNVTVSDQEGCSASAQVTINQPASAISVSNVITATTCGNNDGGISLVTTGGTAPYTYNWNIGSVTASVSSLAAGIYSVTITDNNGCSKQQTFTVQSSNAPVLSVSNITDVTCHGGTNGSAVISVSGGVAPYTWQWQNNVSTGPSATGLAAGTYNVTVTDAGGCQSFQLVNIIQPSAIIVQHSDADTICIGEQLLLSTQPSGGSQPYNYLWSNGSTLSQQNVIPLTSATYMLTVTDSRGCSAAAITIPVTVLQPLNMTLNYPHSVCKGSEVNIELIASGGDGNYSFTWNNGLTGDQQVINVNSDTTITVTLKDGCTTPFVIGTIQIIALNAPELDFQIGGKEGCQPLTVQFNLPPGTPAIYNYLWNFGDNFTSTLAEPQHTYVNPGDYSATLTITYPSAATCSTKLDFPAVAKVYANPKARFAYDPAVITIQHPEVYFVDQSTGATKWEWHFGDYSDPSRDQNPRHVYQDTGAYLVRLNIESMQGCTDSIIDIIHVTDELQIFIPNAFTPDQSGVNDYFNVYGVGFTGYEISIFDRYGKMVHHAKNREHAWDGKDEDGNHLPQGIYVYKVVVTDNMGNKHQRFDHITLIR